MLHLTFEEYTELQKLDVGICLACFEIVEGVENKPKSTCPECGANQMISLETALLYNKVKVNGNIR